MRKKASFTSETILFLPTITTTFLGPNAIDEIRFARPSTFTSSPFSVMAFAEQKKKSAPIDALKHSSIRNQYARTAANI